MSHTVVSSQQCRPDGFTFEVDDIQWRYRQHRITGRQDVLVMLDMSNVKGEKRTDLISLIDVAEAIKRGPDSPLYLYPAWPAYEFVISMQSFMTAIEQSGIAAVFDGAVDGKPSHSVGHEFKFTRYNPQCANDCT